MPQPDQPAFRSVAHAYTGHSWDEDEKVFDAKVLEHVCPYCNMPAGIGCRAPASGIPKTGRFAAKFHMDRVYIAYPSD